MTRLVDYLVSSGVAVDTSSLKIHLACHNGREHPLDVYFAGKFDAWQGSQRQHNFKCNQVVGLIDLGQSEWLFVGVYKILGSRTVKSKPDRVIYSTKLLPHQDELISRVVVHHKRSRSSYIWHKETTPLPIVEIRRQKMTIGEFPGYNAVVLSQDRLKIVTDQQIASWQGALANVKGVYIITDTQTGRHYVGKASGQIGIWQRWCAYAKNGHGGNKELKQLLKQHGPDYMSHFQYSILEIADSHASEADILSRESYWMTALRTREHGLN